MAFSLSTPTSLTSKPFSSLLLPSLSHLHPKPPISSSRKLSNFPPLRITAPSTPISVAEPDQEQDDVSSASISPDTTEEEIGETTMFSWHDHWYPVSLIEDLDPNIPTPFQLLGRDIVLWFSTKTTEWVALDDKCPHRLAPLSVRCFCWLLVWVLNHIFRFF